MGGILTSLNTSYTGLQAHQLMVDTTSNNISNASDEFYSRKRVIAQPERSLVMHQGLIMGRGVEVQAIRRIHDDFVFDRYTKSGSETAFFQNSFDTLREVSAHFPDVDGVGIFNDLETYFNAWKDLSKNPKDSAQKQVLAEATQVLTRNIRDTRLKLTTIQRQASENLETLVKEANRLGYEIAHLNEKIGEMEDAKQYKQANELRDRRDQYEYHLIEIIGGKVFKGHLKTDSTMRAKNADFDENYVMNVAYGFNIVDGSAFHPLTLEKENNAEHLNRVYYRTYDFKDVDITDKMQEGKAGSLISLYNTGYNGTKVGHIQRYIDLLDTFAQGFMEATNAIYAQSAAHILEGTPVTFERNQALKDTGYNFKNGTFELLAYNTNGKVIASKTIKIDNITTMHDIIRQINENTDDNNDNNDTNDFDDYFRAHFDPVVKKFVVQPKRPSDGLYVSIKDNGTNFTGAMGINKFLQGDSAKDIHLHRDYEKDPTYIRPWLAPINGNFDVANMMQQLQYDKIDFFNKRTKQRDHMKVSEFYQYAAGKVATDTEETQRTLDTKKSVYEATKKEHLSITQVSIDEEMVDLIKFQGGYAANAKVITTIDRMIETLLGIKQ
ncbi:flagellar hook-associated protein FlgK [Helicobacter sp. CLO-3]|uniref:flagellar hook-associated protein FlgK n=1 Tax=unclassified Helicobacter TaxID=2593540 RepID=UPI00080522A4|nr:MULTISPECIES: flagellar hook-associated protein FlgK [unclassified Helicobacter]OBV29786.1 flagellar hook-associated protein FlgK [Helicobacter sp. CLO-3]OHU85240.1 flagellar hook-associated protein FlgK [Helicobacter sp. CLO-3]